MHSILETDPVAVEKACNEIIAQLYIGQTANIKFSDGKTVRFAFHSIARWCKLNAVILRARAATGGDVDFQIVVERPANLHPFEIADLEDWTKKKADRDQAAADRAARGGKRRPFSRHPRHKPYHDIDVGQSCEVQPHQGKNGETSIRTTIASYGKRTGKRFRVNKTAFGFRVLRVA